MIFKIIFVKFVPSLLRLTSVILMNYGSSPYRHVPNYLECSLQIEEWGYLQVGVSSTIPYWSTLSIISLAFKTFQVTSPVSPLGDCSFYATASNTFQFFRGFHSGRPTPCFRRGLTITKNPINFMSHRRYIKPLGFVSFLVTSCTHILLLYLIVNVQF